MKVRRYLVLFAKGLFLTSQLYWLFWFVRGVKHFIWGVEEGWFIPVLSDPPLVYGMETIQHTLGMMLIVTCLTPFVLIPIYQCMYLAILAGNHIRKKRKETARQSHD